MMQYRIETHKQFCAFSCALALLGCDSLTLTVMVSIQFNIESMNQSSSLGSIVHVDFPVAKATREGKTKNYKLYTKVVMVNESAEESKW